MAEASAPHDRAAALLGEGRPAEACALLRAALAASPDDAQLHYLLGAAHHAAGALEAALASFDRAATLDPMHAAARQGRAAMLLALGRAEAAFAASAALAESFPHDPQNLANHALLVLQVRGDPAGALALWDRALAIAPALAPARLNRGRLLLQLGQTAAAVANARAFVASHPVDPRAHGELGAALLASGEYEAALEAIERSLALAPGAALLQIKRGYALAALRRFDPARQAFADARALDPVAVDGFRRSLTTGRGALPALDPETIYLARSYERQLECDWSGREAFLEVFRAALARREGPPTERGLAFASLALPLAPEERLALARAVSRHVAASVRAVERPEPGAGRLRIGYLSPDFRNHVTARLVHPVLAAHDRSGFEIFAYALCADDGSGLRASVERAADTFRDLTGEDDAPAAGIIARDRIDVLVDLAGYTLGSRTEILAMRPAPIQAGWLGFPGTMGAGFVDYALVDRVVVPAGREHEWHEQPIFLPETFFVYDAGVTGVIPPAGRREYRLPEDAVVLCAFHHPRKIDPDAFAAWIEVLRAVPGAVLWLQQTEVDYVQNLRREAADRGVAPDRLVCAPREPHERYMARLALADLFLDAFVYNAMSTACDALWMGIPVLTLAGDSPTGRAAASILRAARLPDLVAPTRAAFVALAVRLAGDRLARLAVRERVRASRSANPVFDVTGRARALENAFRAMVARARRGLPPAPLAALAG